MSARAHFRRLARQDKRQTRRIIPDADYGTVAAWCLAESDLPDARASTHDTLLKIMGDERTGGVQWLQWTGDEAWAALREIREGATGEHADYYRRISGHLREYGGWLVLAMAPGKRR